MRGKFAPGSDQAVALQQQADADLKRLTSLFEQKILSQAEFDGAQAKARVSVAALTAGRDAA